MVKPVYVHKIGGSVLYDIHQTQKIIDSIIAIPGRKIIVLSALFGVTDILQKLLSSPKKQSNKLLEIRESHLRFLRGACNDERDAVKKIQEQIKHLEIDLQKYTETNDPFVKARVLSFGERLSVVVFNSLLTKNMKTRICDPADFSLLTTNDPLNAQIISSQINSELLLKDDADLVLVPGFYGYSNTGNLCLVGRGGTDYSAAAIARATSAQKLYFWKDTSGVHSCNPGLNNQSVNFPVISYRLAELLARGGAEILHPRVHMELQNCDTEVVFCHPDFGLKEQTRLIRNKREFGGIFLIDSEIQENRQKSQNSSVLLVSRNIAGLIAKLKQYKLTFPSLRIVQIGNDWIRVEVHSEQKKELIVGLHNDIYSSIDYKLTAV